MQVLYEDSRKVLVSARPSLQVVENDPRVGELKPQVSVKEIWSVPAVAASAPSKWKSNAPKVRIAELDSEVTRFYSEVDVVKYLRAKAARLGRNIEKMTALSSKTANMREKDVRRVANLSAQLAFNVRREDAYKSERLR